MNGFEEIKQRLNLSELDIYKRMHDNLIIDCVNHRSLLELRPSKIHGIGVFSKTSIRKGKTWLASAGLYKFLCGRFINHSDRPNCIFKVVPTKTFCILQVDIEANEELTVSYVDNLNNLEGLNE